MRLKATVLCKINIAEQVKLLQNCLIEETSIQKFTLISKKSAASEPVIQSTVSKEPNNQLQEELKAFFEEVTRQGQTDLATCLSGRYEDFLEKNQQLAESCAQFKCNVVLRASDETLGSSSVLILHLGSLTLARLLKNPNIMSRSLIELLMNYGDLAIEADNSFQKL